MKRLRSYEDLNSFGEKSASKGSASSRPSSHRDYYYKSENARVGLGSTYSARYDRSAEEERDGSRSVRKRSEQFSENFDRRKGFDRHRDYADRGGSSLSSTRGGYGADRLYRSSSFCGARREHPKGHRSDRRHSRREGSVSSWRRFDGSKEHEDEFVSGNDSVRGSKSEVDKRNSRSPKALRDTWPKDSSSEQSKSVDDQNIKEMHAQTTSSSEMEEGELEPESQKEQLPEVEPEDQVNSVICLTSDAAGTGTLNEGIVPDVHDQLVALLENGEVQKKEGEEDTKLEEKADESTPQTCEESCEEKLEVCQHIQNEVSDLHSVATDCLDGHEPNNDGNIKHAQNDMHTGEEVEKVEIPLHIAEKNEDQQDTIPEVSKEDANPSQLGLSVSIDTAPFHVTPQPKEELILNCGGTALDDSPSKSKVLTSDAMGAGPLNDPTSAKNVTNEPVTTCFELFTKIPLKKSGRMDLSLSERKDEQIMLESLDLSLGLPNVLLPVPSCSRDPGSCTQTRSICSLTNTIYTNSDGITTSAFSDSQFIHNPSCSLTRNSLDNYEHSVGSRPIFHGSDKVSGAVLLGSSFNKPKQNDVPNCQRSLLKGSALIQNPQSSVDILNSSVRDKCHDVLESSRQWGLARQLSFQKQFAEMNCNGVNSQQMLHSHEMGFEHVEVKKQARKVNNSCSPYMIPNNLENEKSWIGGTDLVKMIISMIVSESVHVVSNRFHDMSDQTMASLRDCILELLTNESKHRQLGTIQKSLRKRSDLTLDTLLKCHRSLLEVMLALKTGLKDFLHASISIPSSELAEIFLDQRCRNFNCRSFIPVDECDCKLCSHGNGFCSSCMCLLCGKFDMASNTCCWVGCDLCLHWCHTDCGLEKKYIKSGPTVAGSQDSEVQFHCVACGHPSEMYGFVKEVFQNFAKIWPVKTLLKELEYVRRIFCTSKDVRGKQLCDLANELLARIKNGSEPPDIYNSILSFLTERSVSNNVNGCAKGDGSNGLTRQGEAIAVKISSFLDEPPLLGRTQDGVYLAGNSQQDLTSGLLAEHKVVDELERIVKIKEAEANMFQARADGARREAEGLKRIADAKSEKLEEEFATRITKLRLTEAEEMRRQKLEHLHALERAHLDYLNMKVRMEADIKDLMAKMEATKQNLTL